MTMRRTLSIALTCYFAFAADTFGGTVMGSFSNHACLGAPRDCGIYNQAMGDSSARDPATLACRGSEDLFESQVRQLAHIALRDAWATSQGNAVVSRLGYSPASFVNHSFNPPDSSPALPWLPGKSIGQCVRTPLKSGASHRPILWPTSAVWSEDAESLHLVDSMWSQGLTITLEGTISANRALVTTSAQSGRAAQPLQIRQRQNGYLALDAANPSRLLHFESLSNASGITTAKNRPPGRLEVSTGASGEIRVVYDWSPFEDGIVAFGDIEDDRRNWHSAFIVLNEQGNRVLSRLPITDLARDYYLRNVRYIASSNNTNYILLMNKEPSIGAVEPGAREIRALPFFPEDYRTRPQLDRTPQWTQTGQGARQATAFYQTMETSKMPVGLYAWGGHLFVLAKEASINGETAWWLIRVSPQDGAELARTRLPTTAAHLTVVPGEMWALFEKGPVQGLAPFGGPYMSTTSMVLVPSDWLLATADEVADPAAQPQCVPAPQPREPGLFANLNQLASGS